MIEKSEGMEVLSIRSTSLQVAGEGLETRVRSRIFIPTAHTNKSSRNQSSRSFDYQSRGQKWRTLDHDESERKSISVMYCNENETLSLGGLGRRKRPAQTRIGLLRITEQRGKRFI